MTVNWHGWTITPEIRGQDLGKSVESPLDNELVIVTDVSPTAVNAEPVTLTTVPLGPEFGEPTTGDKVMVASGEKFTLASGDKLT